jgi:hypothetical protein
METTLYFSCEPNGHIEKKSFTNPILQNSFAIPSIQREPKSPIPISISTLHSWFHTAMAEKDMRVFGLAKQG